MVLGISFDGLWWGDLLWISRNKRLKSKTWGFIKKDCFFCFFTPILSACIITSSLIHEAMTLMERLFKFWERHLSVQIAYLIEKGFLKARNTSYGSWLWKKGISKAQKVFEGFKDLGSISTIHQLFLIVIVEKVTYNLVNIKFRILLT